MALITLRNVNVGYNGEPVLEGIDLQIEPGERIGIWSPNNTEWVVTQFATARAGLVLVNINPAYRLSEVEYALNKVGCRALVTATSFRTSDYAGMLTTLRRVISITTLTRILSRKSRAKIAMYRAGHETRNLRVTMKDIEPFNVRILKALAIMEVIALHQGRPDHLSS